MAAQIAGLPEVSATLSCSLNEIARKLEAVDHRLRDAHPVTGLPVRESLFAHIAEDLRGGTGAHLLGILHFADYDRIAGFDQLSADKALSQIAERLRKAVRGRHILAQVDRDCLAIWFRTGSADHNLHAEFSATAFVAGQEILIDERHVTPVIEIGKASPSSTDDKPAAILARAIATSKRKPALSYCPSHEAKQAQDEFILEGDLATAIERDELRLVFQPIIDLKMGRLVGAEALLRWTHAQRGAISPAYFIPIAERAGLSDVCGMWVLNAAAREVRAWQDEGLTGLKLAVNLSAYQLLDPNLAVKIKRTIDRHHISPGSIEIELTETAAMADAEHTARVFAELKSAGISLAIDDFGTGYSSMSYLSQLPFDKLKIDREFVADIQKRKNSHTICRAMIELGKGLNLQVLAEGVESKEELDILRDIGCELFQGFYFSRPVSSEIFREIARSEGWLNTYLS